jgi:SAM-dependent methyltransferase
MTRTVDPETYYDEAAATYRKFYDAAALAREGIYPAHYMRLQKLIKVFSDPDIRRVVEIGLGEGSPAFTLAAAGKDVYGFDISEEMVNQARALMREMPDIEKRVIRADINDPVTYISLLSNGFFDGLVAMGVMQHMEKDEFVLSNMAGLLRDGGKAFIMFRNKLFSLFTFNRHTYEFILHDLLQGVSPAVKDRVAGYLTSVLRTDLPPERTEVAGTKMNLEAPVISKFHNPFEVQPLMERCGFTNLRFHWYHYHPAMPSLQQDIKESFRQEAIRLEHEPSEWRGMFLCSAFVVEATRAPR